MYPNRSRCASAPAAKHSQGQIQPPVRTHCWIEVGGDVTAIATLIATAKLNTVDPLAWLADVPARIPGTP